MKLFVVFASICVCIFNITIKECVGENRNSCAYKKTKLTCACKYINLPNISFPILHGDCSRMEILEFPKDADFPELESIDLSHNKISRLDSFVNNFDSFKLRSLKLSYNRIVYVSQDFFQNVPNLLYLDLSNNDIVSFSNSNVFRGLKNLMTLNLGFNRLSTLPGNIFGPLVRLKELDVRYNYLSALVMDSSIFQNSTLELTASIEILKLDGLGITSLNYSYFDETYNLKYLSLADNPLKEVPAVPYTLDILDVSGTDIEVLSPKYLNYHSLKILKLNNLKKLKKIEHYAFYNLQNLQELYVEGAKNLKQFDDLAFGVILENSDWSLKRLSLEGCGLNSLNSTLLGLFKKMDYVNLGRNLWICDCKILWLKELNGTLFGPDNIRCFYPSNLLNRPIMHLSQEDILDCNETQNYTRRILVWVLGSLVTILTILIIYLLYLGPFYYTNKYKDVGPESPYSGNTIRIVPNSAEILN